MYRNPQATNELINNEHPDYSFAEYLKDHTENLGDLQPHEVSCQTLLMLWDNWGEGYKNYIKNNR